MYFAVATRSRARPGVLKHMKVTGRPESLLDDPDHWRRMARQMRCLAETAKDRDALLAIATEYDRLVERAEHRLSIREG